MFLLAGALLGSGIAVSDCQPEPIQNTKRKLHARFNLQSYRYPYITLCRIFLIHADLSKGIKIFTGRANPALAEEIAKHLDLRLGNITVGRFADGEVNVQVNEHIRGKDVYLVQPTLPPVNESLMELLLMISTMRRASARKITAVIPYYGYARQDRKMQARVPISAADVARLLEAMGVDRVVSVDLHCGQIQVKIRLSSVCVLFLHQCQPFNFLHYVNKPEH